MSRGVKIAVGLAAASAAIMAADPMIRLYIKSNTGTLSTASQTLPIYSSGAGTNVYWPYGAIGEPGTGDPLPQFSEPPKPEPPPVPNGNCEICGHEGVIRTLTYFGKSESWQGCAECAKLPYIVIREMAKK